MQCIYLNISINYLLTQFNDKFDNLYLLHYHSFHTENVQNVILFVVYAVYLVLVYVLFWSRFLRELQKELWKTKTVLSIVSQEIVVNVKEIKDFIISNSSYSIASKTNRV